MNRLFFVASSFSWRCSSASFSSLLASAWRNWTCSGSGGGGGNSFQACSRTFNRKTCLTDEGGEAQRGIKARPRILQTHFPAGGGTWGSNKRRRRRKPAAPGRCTYTCTCTSQTMDPHWRSAVFHPSCRRGNAVFSCPVNI